VTNLDYANQFFLSRFSTLKVFVTTQKMGGRSDAAAWAQGCQIFFGTTYQNGEKYTKQPQNVPNGHKIYHMAVN
jgi:hypothetical protein